VSRNEAFCLGKDLAPVKPELCRQAFHLHAQIHIDTMRRPNASGQRRLSNSMAACQFVWAAWRTVATRWTSASPSASST